jgi:ADP-ribosylglycohydrolase
MVRRRAGVDRVTQLVPWTRRIGGRSGVQVDLPAGCYSDDTQLRLATSRAIGSAGFDVEAFAKVELTVWPAYGLGGGRATKAAAVSAAKTTTAWFANTYPGWQDAGGNGAAMRVQPHVWASRSPEARSYVVDVVRNAVCTHSHPRGIIGAVFHALALGHALDHDAPPSHTDVSGLLATLGEVPRLIDSDLELSQYWRPTWEREAGVPFGDAWGGAVAEVSDALNKVSKVEGSVVEGYEECLRVLDLRSPSSRGSGLLTAVAACWLAWSTDDPLEAMVVAANALGSDTDSIATMAGALLGPGATSEPPQDVLDVGLIRSEARRLAGAPQNLEAETFRYPDLLSWTAPRTQADALASTGDGTLVVVGLGPCVEHASRPAGSTADFAWRWVTLWFGQTLLVKARVDLPVVAPSQVPVRQTDAQRKAIAEETDVETARTLKPLPSSGQATAKGRPVAGRDLRPQPEHDLDKSRGTVLDRALTWLEVEGSYSDSAVGYALRRVAREGTRDQLTYFVAEIRGRLQ